MSSMGSMGNMNSMGKMNNNVPNRLLEKEKIIMIMKKIIIFKKIKSL